ncbi:MAG: carboxymuconolactone decarboxylase family protein [Promethearchaeota archaeon]
MSLYQNHWQWLDHFPLFLQDLVIDLCNEIDLKAFQEGLIEKKYKELIALGISIVVNCEPCIYWHIGQVFNLGCKYEEVLEVFEVAIEMGGGPAFARS